TMLTPAKTTGFPGRSVKAAMHCTAAARRSRLTTMSAMSIGETSDGSQREQMNVWRSFCSSARADDARGSIRSHWRRDVERFREEQMARVIEEPESQIRCRLAGVLCIAAIVF